MNRLEFQKKIFNFYPGKFNSENKTRSASWIEAFNRIFPDDGVDYAKLYFYFCTEYENFEIPPMPAFFKKFKALCEIEKTETKASKAPPPTLEDMKKGNKIAQAMFAKFKKYANVATIH